MASDTSFGFGENWQCYINNNFSEDRVTEAENSLKTLLGKEPLKGQTFLDIGCGSGLFSLAAYRLGADTIISFDVDTNSVNCCKKLALLEGSPRNWSILTGSILDDKFRESLPKAEVVYSWGVLHHTGNMWKAIDNAAELVKPGGLFAIGIYNYVGGRRGTETWKRLKRWYCKAPRWLALSWAWAYIVWNLLYMAVVGRNPISHLRKYKCNRGMSWIRDVTDWLGGYPYEAATPGQILGYVRGQFGYTLIRQNINIGLGVSEFVFMREE